MAVYNICYTHHTSDKPEANLKEEENSLPDNVSRTPKLLRVCSCSRVRRLLITCIPENFVETL